MSVVIPTRGDVDLAPVLASLDGFGEILVWNNTRQADYGIYGRYRAIEDARFDVIGTQDDDLVVADWDAILAAYQPGVLTVSYPEPWDIPWVARGAVFDRDLPSRAFEQYLARFPFDRYFTHKACDGVFGLLSETRVIDCGSTDLEHGFWDGRVSTTPGWYEHDRPLIQARCASLGVPNIRSTA